MKLLFDENNQDDENDKREEYETFLKCKSCTELNDKLGTYCKRCGKVDFIKEIRKKEKKNEIVNKMKIPHSVLKINSGHRLLEIISRYYSMAEETENVRCRKCGVISKAKLKKLLGSSPKITCPNCETVNIIKWYK